MVKVKTREEQKVEVEMEGKTHVVMTESERVIESICKSLKNQLPPVLYGVFLADCIERMVDTLD